MKSNTSTIQWFKDTILQELEEIYVKWDVPGKVLYKEKLEIIIASPCPLFFFTILMLNELQ